MARAFSIAAFAAFLFASGSVAVAQQAPTNDGAYTANGYAAGQYADDGQSAAQYYYEDAGQQAAGANAAYAQPYAADGTQQYYYYYEYADEGEPASGQVIENAQAESVAGEQYEYYVDEGAGGYATGANLPAAYDAANIVQGADGQYYYYYEESTGEDTAEQSPAEIYTANDAIYEPADYPASAYTAAQYQYQYQYPSQQANPGGMMSYYVPGADWSHNAQAMFQPEVEVPALPGEEEIDISPPGVDSPDEPTFGEEQERTYQAVIEAAPLQFLRAQSVLLDKGERQIDIGFQYAITEGFILIPQVIGTPPDEAQVISTVRVRQRIMLAPIEIRYGLTDNMQLFVNVPFGWANSELSFPGFDEFDNEGGLGDISAGLSKILVHGCGCGPDVVMTVAMTAPTGPADFPIAPTIPDAGLGQGYWAVQASLLFIQTMDPLVVFYGAGYSHRFDNTFNNNLGSFNVDPGEMFIYQFGVGFAANESVSLSTSFLGLYITEDEVNDIRVKGGILEPMRLRFAATCARPCKIVEPFAEIGMTRDASAARIGITITY